jgi:xanthine/CO dehydrogenase XdhC/CoxF family maturation factor
MPAARHVPRSSSQPRLMLALVLAGASTMALGCAAQRPHTGKLTTRDEMREALWRNIPPGTPLAEAQAFLEREGFVCEPREHEPFVIREHWAETVEVIDQLTYIHARRVDSAGFLMSRYWSIALAPDKHDATTLGVALVSSYVDGP